MIVTSKKHQQALDDIQQAQRTIDNIETQHNELRVKHNKNLCYTADLTQENKQLRQSLKLTRYLVLLAVIGILL